MLAEENGYKVEIADKDTCIYYLMREMGGLGIKAGEKYFEGILQHIRENGLVGWRNIEIQGVIAAAMRRNRENDLDTAVEEGFKKKLKDVGVE